MKRSILTLLLAGLACCSRASAQTVTYAEKVQRYIATYKDLAMAEQQRSGIPAAITLAQGILESGAGESELATAAGNHFGIKCKSNWTGETYNHDDDAPDECFRKYASAEHSYRDHTDYLKTANRYTPCFAQSTTDYAAWAYQLKTCGYATSPTYAQRLIKIIEDYKLQQFTYAALDNQNPLRNLDESRTAVAGEVVPENDAPATAAPIAAEPVRVGEKPATSAVPRAESSRLSAHSETPEEARAREVQAQQARVAADAKPVAIIAPVAADGTSTKDGRRGFYAKKGDVLLEDAIRYRIRYAKLLEINGIPDEPLSTDRFIYLEKATTSRIEHDVAAMAAHDETARVASGATRPTVAAAPVAPASSEMVASTIRVAPAQTATTEITRNGVPEKEAAREPEAEQTPPSNTVVNVEIPGLVPEPAQTRKEEIAVQSEGREEARPGAVSEESTAAENPIQPTTTPERTPVARDVAAPQIIASTEPVVNAPVLEVPASNSASVESNSPAIASTVTKPADGFNIAGEVAVDDDNENDEDNRTASASPAAEPEPKDEMSRLKARFDKAVYAPAKPRTAQPSSAPVVEVPVPVKAAPVAASSASGGKFYTVQKGDTAFGIAKKHGITVKQLQDWNGLSMDAGVPMGKKLKVQP